MFIVKFLAKPRRAREGGDEAAGDGGHGVDMKGINRGGGGTYDVG